MKLESNLTALQVMQDAPVIPVIVLNDVALAVPLARALVAGGIRMLEVTLRTPQALPCIEAIARGYSLRFPDDLENLEHQFEVYDALYAFLRLKTAAEKK